MPACAAAACTLPEEALLRLVFLLAASGSHGRVKKQLGEVVSQAEA